jgi:hypothetical protein
MQVPVPGQLNLTVPSEYSLLEELNGAPRDQVHAQS